MKLKAGQMWDHNGTYMDGIGFRYQDHKVVIELASEDNMHGTQILFFQVQEMPGNFTSVMKVFWLLLRSAPVRS